MKLKLISCTAQRPDRRSISKTLEEIADDTDNSLASELTDVLLEGSSVEIEVSFNTDSALRALRKLSVDYEFMD